MRFADLAAGGRAVAALLPADLLEGSVLVGVPPGGLAVGAAVSEALGVEVTPLVVTTGELGVEVEVTVDVGGRRVVVLDGGVETGTAARAVIAALRAAGASYVVLAVPVCPRDAEADLRHRYDEVIAVTKPFARRSLRWHYETFA